MDLIDSAVAELPPKLAVYLAQVMRYTIRTHWKGSPVKDLMKARWFITRALSEYKKEQNAISNQ